VSKYELFSMRQKRKRGEVPEVYVYDSIPPKLRVQVIHIWGDALGHDNYQGNRSEQAYTTIHARICRDYGCFSLGDAPNDSAENQLRKFLGTCTTESALDVIELSFRYINALLRNNNEHYALGSSISADEAIAELNEWFRWHGVGYQFESGFIVRVDSQFLHSEAVKPALVLLSEAHYAGANAEFLNAFEHYRHGRTKECLTECLKAFESTMKAICTKRKWAFKSTDTAKALIEVCFREDLVPSLMQSHISGIRSTLESGIPTIRNKLSGHGQGPAVVDVPPHYASYMLHLTATTIQFLIESEKAMK
jgi:AbiJ N-terminal domain 4